MIAFIVALGKVVSLGLMFLACIVVMGPEREGTERGKGM